jgi:hypothetical protein
MDKIQVFVFIYPADAVETCAKIKEWCPEIIPGIFSIEQKDFKCTVWYRDTHDRWALMIERHMAEQKKEYDKRGESHSER